jgi:hypothetical protein
MTTTFRWYLVGLLALFGAYVALEYYRPKPIDWSPTLINKDKIPYGTYVLYDQLPRLLGTDSVETTRLPIYNQLTGVSLEVTDAMAAAETHSVTVEADNDTVATAKSPDDSTATAAATAALLRKKWVYLWITSAPAFRKPTLTLAMPTSANASARNLVCPGPGSMSCCAS